MVCFGVFYTLFWVSVSPYSIRNFGIRCSSIERTFLSHTAVVNLYSARPHIKCRSPPNRFISVLTCSSFDQIVTCSAFGVWVSLLIRSTNMVTEFCIRNALSASHLFASCISSSVFTSCIRRSLVSRACRWVMSALYVALLIFSFQFSLLFFHISAAACQAAPAWGVLLVLIRNIGHRTLPKIRVVASPFCSRTRERKFVRTFAPCNFGLL